MYKQLTVCAFLGGLTAATPYVAAAGPFADDVAKCLVKSTSDKDRTDLVQWIYAAMSLHPDLASMSKIGSKERDQLNATIGKLYSRLMFEDCRSELVQAVQNEGAQTIEYAFNILGQVAARGLFSDPHVTQSMQALQKSLDQAKLKELMAAAGAK